MTTAEPAPRNRYRTSIIGLGIVVALLIIRLLSEAVPGMFLGSLAYSVALALNALALVAAIGGTDVGRRMGIGYAICGWVYLLFAYFEEFGHPPPLITSLIFDSALGTGTGPRYHGGLGGSTGQLLWAGHSLVTVLAGMVGAWSAARLLGREPRLDGLPLDAPAAKPGIPKPAPAGKPSAPLPGIHPLDRTD